MPTSYTAEPVFVLTGKRQWGDFWCKVHISSVERKPVVITSLEQLRGIRYRTVIILEDANYPPEHKYLLERNTVIDLRNETE